MEARAGGVWIFAYGSLIWRPGFAYEEATIALLRGYHRAFCILSVIYRGTRDRPGLVLGLDRGGSCWGRAYRVAAEKAQGVLAALDRREVVSGVYVRRLVPVSTGARRLYAHAYIADRASDQYVGRLPEETLVRLLSQGAGTEGRAADYLENTVRHLEEAGIPDRHLHRLLVAVKRRSAGRPQAHLE